MGDLPRPSGKRWMHFLCRNGGILRDVQMSPVEFRDDGIDKQGHMAAYSWLRP
jgi:hypothetical protein